jgi:hypothetical protein
MRRSGTPQGAGPADWLRAGEATSAALLIATQNGLATTVLSQAAEVSHTRRQLAGTALQVPEHAQLVLRVGWAPGRCGSPARNPAPSPALCAAGLDASAACAFHNQAAGLEWTGACAFQKAA